MDTEVERSSQRSAQRIDEHVGERIRERRTLMGLTQEELAEALSVSYQQLQKYETAVNRVSAGRLFEIAEKLDVDIGYFFDGLIRQTRDEPLPHGGRNRIAIDLMRHFMDIADPEVRGAVVNLVRSLASRKNGLAAG